MSRTLQPPCDRPATRRTHDGAVSTTDHTHLTTGWEADTPTGDTVLRRYLHCWARLTETFAVAGGGHATWAPGYAAADLGRASGFFNAATLLRPLEPDGSDAVLDDIEGFFGGGTGEAHLWSAWPTPDLRARGWHLVGHPPLLVRPPGAVMPPAASTRSASVDLDVVTDPDGLADWEQVAVEGYPLDELIGAPPGSLAHPRLLDDPRLQFTVGRHHGAPASIGTLFTDEGIGCFALGVTRPGARHQGHWWAHAVHRIDAAPEVWMTGVFSDDSRPGAERLGFLPVLRFTLWLARGRDRRNTDTTTTTC